MRVLFLCTGNSARSQIAEALLRHLSKGQVEVFSAGSRPQPAVHPLAISILRDRYGIDASALRPKPMTEYLDVSFDDVITVCDNAAESCAVFPGTPRRIHWSIADPAAVEDPDARRQAFERVTDELAERIRAWLKDAR